MFCDLLKLWNLNEGEVIRTLSGSSAGVNSAIFTADGKSLISGSAANDSKLRIWHDLGKPELRKRN